MHSPRLLTSRFPRFFEQTVINFVLSRLCCSFVRTRRSILCSVSVSSLSLYMPRYLLVSTYVSGFVSIGTCCYPLLCCFFFSLSRCPIWLCKLALSNAKLALNRIFRSVFSCWLPRGIKLSKENIGAELSSSIERHVRRPFRVCNRWGTYTLPVDN